MTDAVLQAHRKRLANLRIRQAELRRKDTEWLITNALIGQMQSIIAEHEQLAAAAPKRDDRKRRRVWARAKAFALSPVSEIHITQGEQEARLIVHYLDARGVAAEVVQRGEKWIVRKTKGESE